MIPKKMGNFNRPTIFQKKKRKLVFIYGLPTLVQRVELAFVQQTKKHT